MKLQQLSVIFVIIILPITLVVQTYVNNLIDVTNIEKNYDTILYNATYDCVRAYQMNTLNNSFASVNKSRDRDIEASVNSFFNSLAMGFSSSGYTKDALKDYIPAILLNLYDGYYIYGPYENAENNNLNNIEYGVKPYIYYSCEYSDDATYDIIVNYTLDNYISVSGTINGEYITKAGYYINYDGISFAGNNVEIRRGNNSVILSPENLSEYISIDRGAVTKYNYVNYNEEKLYKGDGLFKMENGGKKEMKGNITESPEWTDAGGDINYYYYYKNAVDFSKFINEKLKNISITPNGDGTYKNVKTEYFNKNYNIITKNGAKADSSNLKDANVSHVKTDYGDGKIFALSSENDPELESSLFNRHRIDVIVSSIENTLTNAIASFNNYQSSTYSYIMPAISEEDWYKMANNLCILSFMQGKNVGNYKYYNNYAIVTNTKNKEFVSKDAIFVQDVSNSDSVDLKTDGIYYHNPRCSEYNVIHKDDTDGVVGYRMIDYEPQSYVKDGVTHNYYLQPGTGAYECVVSLTKNYLEYDDLMSLKTGKKETNTSEDDIYYSLAVDKAFIQALAREKNATSKIFEVYNT